jgi:hypothetical protein
MSAARLPRGNDVEMTMQVHDEGWITYFRQQGHPDVRPLATGMEGAVYRLGGGLVAKVWGGEKRHDDLVKLQRFYADLCAQSLPFATPEVVDLENVDGTSVTIERELSGRPLHDHLSEGATTVAPAAQECLGVVLASLAATRDLASARALAVLSEPQPMRRDLDWPSALVALLNRRVGAFGVHLRAAVDDFDALLELITESIRTMEQRPAVVVHGDLCGVNILVDEDLRPTAVLDWGFLTTAGDPAFDASVAAGIFDMYGAHAATVDRQLCELVAQRLGVPHDDVLVYRAAYAVATSNAYDEDGQDGHFAWCANALSRPDIRAALHRSASR